MLEQRAYEEFLDHNAYPGEGLQNHCRRLKAFTLSLSQLRGVPVDEDLVGAGTWLHDLGLMVQDPDEPNYLKRGLGHCEPLLESWDLEPEQRKEVVNMLLYNHSLRTVPNITPTAELLRQAVHVEHSRGVIRSGLSRAEVKRIFKEFPRDNFNQVLVDFARVAVLKDGAGTLLPIFFPG